ncbi:unnamed protein product [Acanthoscelides obtectus]|uniref:Uncharacterized protein n=1 Tax=Acanthoscelides obtectus TaxID=200917 RepID=A0A9P0JW74_ACAOB|nr:unnamed protein product [Acanthoscelides obtectus]CAK1663820.1 hypothetical protein AOBTE_LOCUS23872 [Acanthoscelides obtectus]
MSSQSFLMCLILLSVSCEALGFTAEGISTDIRFIKTCNLTSPISMTTMNEFLFHKKLANGESSAFKCFLHCLFAKYGWMDDEGGFLLHDIKVTLEEAEVEIDSLEFILYTCTAMNSVDKCQRAYTFTHCFWQKIAEVGTVLSVLLNFQ